MLQRAKNAAPERAGLYAVGLQSSVVGRIAHVEAGLERLIQARFDSTRAAPPPASVRDAGRLIASHRTVAPAILTHPSGPARTIGAG